MSRQSNFGNVRIKYLVLEASMKPPKLGINWHLVGTKRPVTDGSFMNQTFSSITTARVQNVGDEMTSTDSYSSLERFVQALTTNDFLNWFF